jgi:hypothetical protein
VSKQIRLRLIFAGLGLAIAGAIYASGGLRFHEELPRQVSIFLEIISMLACPPSLLSFAEFDV